MAFFSLSGACFGEELVKISISPFMIYDPRVSKDVGRQIAQRLSYQIINPKIEILAWKQKNIAQDIEEAKKVGKKQNLDYLIMGSLKQVEEKFGLELSLIKIAEEGYPLTIYREFSSMEDLDTVLVQIGKEIVYNVLGERVVFRLEVIGNKIVDKEAILAVMKTKQGEVFDERLIRQDIKSIFKMGFFKDIKVEQEQIPQGVIIRFIVFEKPLLKEIEISGNEAIKDDEIRDVITIKENTILKEKLLTQSIEQIKKLYQKEGYFDVKITYEVSPISPEAEKVTFIISEGEKAYIEKIFFEGNESFKDKKLKKQMANKEKWIFSFITGSGRLKRDELENDMNRLANFYYNHGYINAKIGEPQIKREEREIYISIPIEEGEQYRVGKISLGGDLIKPKDELERVLRLKSGDVYGLDKLHKDISNLSDVYANLGFAFVEVDPKIEVHPKSLTVDISYEIEKRMKVYIRRIGFEGNVKTRDKVIRRELLVREGETFSKEKLEKSIEMLQKLGYFEEVQFDMERGKWPDEVDVEIKVKEQSTGAFSIGAGYSSIEDFMVIGEISQRNLFGRGQELSFRGYIGSVTQRYTINFLEPYLFDTGLSAGLQVYKWDIEYIDFTKESTGGEVRFGHRLGLYSSIFAAYRYEEAETTDFNPWSSRYIKELEDGVSTSALRLTWERDTRNRFFYPTKGTILSTTLEYAGLGGDSEFLRYEGSVAGFIPLFWDTVGFIRAKGGYIDRVGDGVLPIFEKYFLGGSQTIRGYDFAAISPRDPETGERIGGNKMFLCNVEYRFPIIKKMRLTGVVFFDMGNVYGDNEDFDLTDIKKSVGFGVRWFSPMGPIRIEFGFALDAEEEDDTSNWEFAMGTFF